MITDLGLNTSTVQSDSQTVASWSKNGSSWLIGLEQEYEYRLAPEYEYDFSLLFPVVNPEDKRTFTMDACHSFQVACWGKPQRRDTASLCQQFLPGVRTLVA